MLNATRTSRVGDTVVVDDGSVMDNCFIDIGIVDDGGIYVDHGRVVGEAITAPFATGEAKAHVTEAVVDAAIVADVPTPIAVMEDIVATLPSPVRRGPKESRLRHWDPSAGDPIVPVIAVSPVPRSPHQAVFRAGWLFVNGEHGGSDVDADEHAGKRRCRDETEQKSKQKQARRAEIFHCNPPVNSRAGGRRIFIF